MLFPFFKKLSVSRLLSYFIRLFKKKVAFCLSRPQNSLMKVQKKNSATQDPRIYWAKERTFLAWLRTGLALMGFGFVVARFGLFLRMIRLNEPVQAAAQPSWSMWIGTSLVFLSVLIQVGSTVDYYRFISRFHRGENPEPSFSWLGLVTASCLILVGMAMAIYLLWEG